MTGMSELLKATTLTTEQEGFADSIRVCAGRASFPSSANPIY